METHSVHTMIRDLNISNKDQKKLKKLEDLAEKTYWTYYMNDDRIEKWHEDSLLDQELSVQYYRQDRVEVTFNRVSSIHPSQIGLVEKALGAKCHEISVDDKGHIELTFSLNPKYFLNNPKPRVDTKEEINHVPMEGIKRVAY